MSLSISIAPELSGRVRLGILVLDGVTVREADEALAGEAEVLARDLRARHGQGKSGEVPGASDARNLYKALGLDPTKTRPSSEALLRRVLKGEPLSRINTLVDALNLCALRFQLPFGLYDLDRIEPPVTLRRGAEGEAYEGIRKGPVHVAGRPVLSDVQGPFGNPTSDSARTMITLNTRNALVTAYAPASHSLKGLEEILRGTGEGLMRFSGGSCRETQIL
jgi:DNA/RNA-binding domain of Phe-tRNA-synthetase-like protein